jgi:hypothetical protein
MEGDIQFVRSSLSQAITRTTPHPSGRPPIESDGLIPFPHSLLAKNGITFLLKPDEFCPRMVTVAPVACHKRDVSEAVVA